jgi:excisionase family DNA binding protein
MTSAEVARMAGVGTTAVKRWADSGALPCLKTAGGHRRFRRQDVERLMQSGAPAGEGEWDDWIDALIGPADVHAVQARLFEERDGRGSWTAVAEALGGLLNAMGERWARGRLSVIDEHLASAALQRALAAVSETIPVARQAPRCLLATAEGDAHTLGLSLVELCLREAGWRPEWAGSRTRVSDVVDRLATGGLAMVAISAAVSSSDAGMLARAAGTIAEACEARQVALAFGGEGAWPAELTYGVRFRALSPFYDFALERRRAGAS